MGDRSKPNWVFVDDVVKFHDQAIENHGGRHGIRSHGLLHQALTRPERRWYYDGMDNLARIAACYTASSAKTPATISLSQKAGTSMQNSITYGDIRLSKYISPPNRSGGSLRPVRQAARHLEIAA